MQDVEYEDHCTSDVMPIFTGDSPAEWLEVGEQHQGLYGCSAGCGAPIERFCDLGFCMRRPVKSMEDRRLLVGSLPAGRKGGIAPFNSLKKQDLIRNLGATNIDFDLECNKPGLEKQLREHLAGVSNVPALQYGDQHRTVDELNLGQYEIAPCEALHNSKEHIKNILEELPNHLCGKDKAAMKEVAAMFQGKEMQRGVDYRKHLLTVTVKMATQDGNPKAIALLESLCNITHILYLGEQDRTNQQILRLANQTYLHGILVREVIGTETKSITKRKLYGQYWHSLTTHAPMLYRIVNLKSVNAENQERMFDSLKGILGQTSSRRPSEVVGMGVLRLQAEQTRNTDNLSKDENSKCDWSRPYGNLEAHDKCRPIKEIAEDRARSTQYAELLKVNGTKLPDPLLDLNEGWLKEKDAVEQWPPVGFTDIAKWLLCEAPCRRLFVKTTCTPSQSIRNIPHTCWVAVDKKSGRILSAYCSCLAGLGSTCNHVAARMFKMEHTFMVVASRPCTSKESNRTPINKTTKKLFNTLGNRRNMPTAAGLLDAMYPSCQDSTVFKYMCHDKPPPPTYPPEADFNLGTEMETGTVVESTPLLSLSEMATRKETDNFPPCKPAHWLPRVHQIHERSSPDHQPAGPRGEA
ncbi:AP-5 complex subunit zeta-1 [Branchiostoma belcheri]|nr:AP-5 complex subunit zeta-1 [Branchiostoma belcheri]